MKPLLPTAGLLALLALGTATPSPETASPTVAPSSVAPATPASTLSDAGVVAPPDAVPAPVGVVIPFDSASAAVVPAANGSLAVRVRGDLIPHAVFGLFVQPGEVVPISRAAPDGASGSVQLEVPAGGLRAEGPTAWTWTAPETPGLHRLRLTEPATGRATILNAFVVRRLDAGTESVGGYVIGKYPPPLAARPERYAAPGGFVEVTAENRDVLVAPHFTLGQFVCKQGSGWPKYVVLREALLLKLEAFLEAANRRGWKGKTFHVMSGYRTPAYNKGLGNVGASRHLYGDAADIFLDDDGNGSMDDLNRDGKVDRADAVALHDLFAEVEGTAALRPYLGGLGIYPANAAHGPFVHVDARGSQARWGE